MPYLVTTTTPEPAIPAPHGEQDDGGPDVTRRATATLDDAKQEANRALHGTYDLLADVDYARLGFAIDNLTEAGGTVTLPDGTTITVARVTEQDLVNALPASERSRIWSLGCIAVSSADLIDAYNAAQS